METPEIEKKLQELETRMNQQEHLHRHVDPDSGNVIHWDNTSYSVLLASIIISSLVTLVIVKIF